MQVNEAKEALSREQRLKEQLREQLTTAAEESKRQVGYTSIRRLYTLCNHCNAP